MVLGKRDKTNVTDPQRWIAAPSDRLRSVAAKYRGEEGLSELLHSEPFIGVSVTDIILPTRIRYVESIYLTDRQSACFKLT